MRKALVVSTAECFSRLARLLPSALEIFLVDHKDLGSLAISSRKINYRGLDCLFDDVSYLFFYPGSTEEFLLGSVLDNIASDAEEMELNTRSSFAFRLGFLSVLNRICRTAVVIGNDPTPSIFAANRVQFRLDADRTDWQALSGLPRASCKTWREGVARFLPDTHVFYRNRVAAPFKVQLDTLPDPGTSPWILERLYNMPFDVRVYVFGDDVFGFFWERSLTVVDIRIESTEIFAKELPEAILNQLRSVIASIQNKEKLHLFSLDFVSDFSTFIAVDLNVCPSWHWHGVDSAMTCDAKFALYVAAQCS